MLDQDIRRVYDCPPTPLFAVRYLCVLPLVHLDIFLVLTEDEWKLVHVIGESRIRMAPIGSIFVLAMSITVLGACFDP